MPTKLRKYDFNDTCEEHLFYLPPKIRYDKDAQAPEPPDSGNLLPKPDMKYVQCLVSSLLFYGRVTYATIIKALNILSQTTIKTYILHIQPC